MEILRPSQPTKTGRAIRRGLDFIHRKALNRQILAEYGSDLLWCFFSIASTIADAKLRDMTWKRGQEHARIWLAENPLPRDADPDTVIYFIYGGYAARQFGLRDEKLHEQIRRAMCRSSAQDYLGFDPVSEPPPSDVPDTCGCGVNNERGRKRCVECKKQLTMMSRYLVWYDALIRAYTANKYDVPLGVRYADVIKWIPAMRPYCGMSDGESDFHDTAYAVTHVVYTLNDYNTYRLSPRWLSAEFAFLKANFRNVIAKDDPEMVGEFLDTLRAFGLTEHHPIIRTGSEYLLSKQNVDGSWGEMDSEDIYTRYHSTWTAIDGLRDYAWRGKRLSFPELKPLLVESQDA